MGSRRDKVPKDIFLEQLYKPSLKGGDGEDPNSVKPVAVLLITPDWTQPYINFLVNGEVPEDEVLNSK